VINKDPVWVETAYLAIVRRRQMEELRMIPEDEWPDKTILADYDSIFPDDVNYYTPQDLILPLGSWLRDHRIRARKEQVRAKNQNKSQAVMNDLFAY
jgi:hypothetical protein